MTDFRRPLPAPTPCMVFAAIALAIGLVTGFFAAGDGVLPGDIRIATAIQRTSGPLASALAETGNAIGVTMWAALAIAIAILAAAWLRARAEVVFLATLLVLRLAAIPLKGLFASPRPTADIVSISGAFDGYGYPSGHSLTAATLCLGLAVLAWRLIPSRNLALAAIAVCIGLMILVGWARIWVGAHWPSDVIGGFAFGVVIVAIAGIVMERVETTRAITNITRT